MKTPSICPPIALYVIVATLFAAGTLYAAKPVAPTGEAAKMKVIADYQAQVLAARNNYITAMGNLRNNYITAMGNLMKAKAEADAMHVKSMIDLEEVRSKRLDNKLKKSEVFYAKRKQHRDYRSSEQKRKRGQATAVPYEIAPRRSPPRPTPNRLNLSPTSIDWPMALKGSQFSTDRGQIERLVAQRSARGDSSTAKSDAKLSALASQMHKKLKTRVEQLPPEIYMKSLRFLKALAHQTQFSQPPQRRANDRR